MKQNKSSSSTLSDHECNAFDAIVEQPSIESDLGQKVKQQHFRSSKNKDSSSSNGSIEISSLHKSEAPPSMQWKYSRTHQKRFHRRFPTINQDEQLIDWFACALLADILLQGYLYISQNYFAFYSNIFGYKTHIIIPIDEVTSVTKEKTAKIFPNAVGISSKTHRYVFGSLFSRENTHKLLKDVWQAKLNYNKISDEISNEDLEDKQQFTSVLNANIKMDDDIYSTELTELQSLRTQEPEADDQKNWTSPLLFQDKSNSLGNPISWRSSGFALLDHQKTLRRRRLHRSETDCSIAASNASFAGHLQSLRASKRADQIRFAMKKFLNGSSFLFIIVGVVILLFVSAAFLLIKINHAYSKILEINPNRTGFERKMLVGEQLNRVVSLLKTNLNEIDQIKNTIEKLLQSVPPS